MNDPQFQTLTALLQNFKEETQEQFISINQRFDTIDTKFQAIDKRFDVMDNKFKHIDERFDIIDKRFDIIDDKFKIIDEKFEYHNQKFEHIYEEIKDLKYNQKEDHSLLMDIWKSRDKVTAEVTWKFISQASALNMTLLFIMWGFMSNFS
jgi:chromosome segregation ATPase